MEEGKNQRKNERKKAREKDSNQEVQKIKVSKN
jgi:hypothetical protein